MIGDENGLPKDLREMDEEQFVEVFDLLREKTKDFKEINKELLKENPQFLFVFRILLGLSQSELAKKLKVNKLWVRHFESGRQGFKQSKVIPTLVDFLIDNFSNNDINLQKSLEILKINQLARKKNIFDFPEPKFRIKRIFEMTPSDFEFAFKILRNKTRNFKVFDNTILISNPQFISIFRIILNMGILRFSKVIEVDDSNIRRWESLRDRIMPDTAEIIIRKIEALFKDHNLVGKVKLNNVMKNFQNFTFFEQNELKIKELLEKASIPFEVHKEIKFNKKRMNIDFIIPNTRNPKVILEVTKISKRKRKDLGMRVDLIDHRFQLIKINNPEIRTFMFLECENSQVNLIKRIIEREVVNADTVIINSLEDIPTKIKEIIN